jgi:hypothetical protein
MSRICDFCERTEYEVEKMAEQTDSRRQPNVCICLECAKLAVARMEAESKDEKPDSYMGSDC